MCTARDAQHRHALVVPEPRQELGRDEEVLAVVLAAGNLDHAVVDHAFVAGVHALVDLIDYSEWRLRAALEREEEEGCCYGAFAAGLACSGKADESLLWPVVDKREGVSDSSV